MGGKTAMVLALHYPELVDKLVVLDVAPVLIASDTNDGEDLVQALKSLDLSSFQNRREADAAIRHRIPVSGVYTVVIGVKWSYLLIWTCGYNLWWCG